MARSCGDELVARPWLAKDSKASQGRKLQQGVAVMLIPGWLTRPWHAAYGTGMAKVVHACSSRDTGRVLAPAPQGPDAAQHLSRAPWQGVTVCYSPPPSGTEAAPHLLRAAGPVRVGSCVKE